MADILSTSLSGMLAFQQALATTSHNVANANTPGYSRQIVEFSSRVGQGSGNGYVGSGVQVSTIKRAFDALLSEQYRTSMSGQARFSTLDFLAGRIDTLLADPDTGLNSSMQSFFAAAQDLANDPASIPTRQALLGEADGIASRFASLDKQLNNLSAEVNSRLTLAVEDINRLAVSLADLNDKIALSQGPGTQPQNDLLDQRDELVRQLSTQVAVTTSMQEDGTMSIFIGSGQTLVIGSEARSLSTQPSEFDPTRLNVVYDGTTGATALDNSLTGGTLGGLLEFRNELLDPARQSLGQTAVAFATQFNAQHNAGMDLMGNLGQDVFSISPPGLLYSSNNIGSGTVDAQFSDLGGITGADYVLDYDGTSYSLRRTDNNQAIAMSGSGTAGDPFVADGISIVVAGAPAAGDSVMIQTGTGIAGSMGVLITDPQALALAAPTRSSASINNTGDATISPATVDDVNDPSLLTSSVIEFTSPTTYTIDGAGSFTYTEGTPIVVNGSSVTISGAPAAGDQFTIDPNFGASGDNSNGLLLAATQSVGVLDGGTININENYAQLVSTIGSATSQVQANLAAQNVVLANAENSYLSTSGVNLDEEAANLIRYQQAYQAVAQVVSVANTLFDSLLNATSR